MTCAIRSISTTHLLVAGAIGIVLAAAMPVLATAPVARKDPLLASVDGCASLRSRTSYRYVVTGRARPLIVWTSRRDVGAARITRATGAQGDQRIDLLIGTDPERAPMKINRWGYTSEASCQGRTHVVGVMTQADEQTIEAATVAVGSTAGESHHYRAVRGTVAPGVAETELLRLSTGKALTHRDLDEMLNLLPSPGPMAQVSVPADAAPGFLLAMANELGSEHRAANRRSYVYSGVLYSLHRSASTERTTVVVGARSYGTVLDTSLETRNAKTGEITRFQVTSGTAATGADLAGVPLRVTYRPRWWLELELLLDEVQR